MTIASRVATRYAASSDTKSTLKKYLQDVEKLEKAVKQLKGQPPKVQRLLDEAENALILARGKLYHASVAL